MARQPKKIKRKHYTVEQANAMLPLLRSILRDVTQLANDLRTRHDRLLQIEAQGSVDEAHGEELRVFCADYQRDQERMREYEKELESLHVELKDYYAGLIDFPALMDGREVFLCWRLGEPEVGHWHDLDAGFSGRQKINETAAV